MLNLNAAPLRQVGRPRISDLPLRRFALRKLNRARKTAYNRQIARQRMRNWRAKTRNLASAAPPVGQP